MSLKAIKIGWSQKEIIWLRAALTLPGYDCLCALDDIASMSGRTLGAVRAKAKEIQREPEPDPVPAPAPLPPPVPPRQILVPVRSIARVCEPVTISPPTKARMMGRRA